MKFAKLTALVVTVSSVSNAHADESVWLTMRNLSLGAKVSTSSELDRGPAKNAVDGKLSTRWLSKPAVLSWLEIDLGRQTRVGGVHVYSGQGETAPINNFIIQYQSAGQWEDIPSGTIRGNDRTAVWIKFSDDISVCTNRLRVLVAKTPDDITRIKEVTVWPYLAEGIPALGRGVEGWVKPIDQDDVPLIYLNQSGFNLHRPKRFTAPTLKDGTPFIVRQRDKKTALFSGTIRKHIGDFSKFNPIGDEEFVVESVGHTSFPFRIAPYWLERVTYQNAINFMIDSRHYVGTSAAPIGNSVGWRDDCHFAFEVNTLVAQYLSNPVAYQRMPGQIRYRQPHKLGLWGELRPYSGDAPDIVKLIHWGTDVIVSQDLRHEMLKEQLAYFLYAWPWLDEWLPQQNYDVVSEYAFAHWSAPTINRKYAFDKSLEHNLLAVKKVIGTTKGEMPPGHSLQPNLLMYEVAKRQGREDTEKYFDAAFAQAKWMIANLDWNDPQTTKGQRQSEHVTMTGLAHFAAQYPHRAPAGLRQKIVAWAKIMVRRSDNMWDFRKLSDRSDWVPSGAEPTMWNEPGNVVGFPACLLSAMQVVEDPQLNDRLQQLAYSHMDNAFGRNPTGRHFSYDARREIEGVEIGWYSKYGRGVGMLEKARFVLEAAPKKEHYPYNPAAANVGWSEGWVNHNTAFNISLAYFAHHDTNVRLIQKRDTIDVQLHAPLNFELKVEPVTLRVAADTGDTEDVTLKEMRHRSEKFVGKIEVAAIAHSSPKIGDGILQIKPNGSVEAAYGFGYLQRRDRIQLGRLTTPTLTDDAPAAGKRVRQVAPEYKGSDVFHSLYLPREWQPKRERKFPVLVEYTGNKWSPSGSTGKLADANLGYGLTGGDRFIWVVLPCVEKDRKSNAVEWWGDLKATLDYCKVNVPRICEQFDGDPKNVILCGFSRGAIAANYLGLHDDEIAKLWKAFITHDHYDGVFPVSDSTSTLVRLKRLKGRPQLICSAMGTGKTRQYMAKHTSLKNLAFLDVPVNELFKIPDGKIVHPHTDLWMHIDSTYRQRARKWLREVIATVDRKSQP